MAVLSRETKWRMLKACDEERIHAIGRRIERVFLEMKVTTLEAFVSLEALSFGVVEGSHELQEIIAEDNAIRIQRALSLVAALHQRESKPEPDPEAA